LKTKQKNIQCTPWFRGVSLRLNPNIQLNSIQLIQLISTKEFMTEKMARDHLLC